MQRFAISRRGRAKRRQRLVWFESSFGFVRRRVDASVDSGSSPASPGSDLTPSATPATPATPVTAPCAMDDQDQGLPPNGSTTSLSSAAFATRGSSIAPGGPGKRGTGLAAGTSSRGSFPPSSRGTTCTLARGRGRPFPNKSVTFHHAKPLRESGDEEGLETEATAAAAASAFAYPVAHPPEHTILPAAIAADPTIQHPFAQSAHVSAGSSSPISYSGEAKDDEDRRKRFQATSHENRFLEMKAQRSGLRGKYIASGVIPDPEKPQQLSDATKLRGTCMEMCPAFEREERQFQGEGDELEVFPGTTRLDPKIAVKIYRRPAAGRELPLPEDVRPPSVLRKTLDYLFHKLLPASPASDRLHAVQGFIWNRTRAIRQDFIVQGEQGPLTIECHERIARWHIFSLHWQGGSIDEHGRPRESLPIDRDPWSQQQELEQLAKTLTSLCEFYDDLRTTAGTPAPSPNEAEFRAYHLILNIFDPEVARSVELLPEQIFNEPMLQTAIRFRGYAQRANRGGSGRANALNTDAPMNFFSRFTHEMRSSQVPYLLACMLENQLGQIREGALKALSSNYNKAHRGPSVAFVKEVMGADSEEQVLEWAALCDVHVQSDSPEGLNSLKLYKGMELNIKGSISNFSIKLVESKRRHLTSQQIIDGWASSAAPLIPVDNFNRGQPTQTKAQQSSTAAVITLGSRNLSVPTQSSACPPASSDSSFRSTEAAPVASTTPKVGSPSSSSFNPAPTSASVALQNGQPKKRTSSFTHSFVPKESAFPATSSSSRLVSMPQMPPSRSMPQQHISITKMPPSEPLRQGPRQSSKLEASFHSGRASQRGPSSPLSQSDFSAPFSAPISATNSATDISQTRQRVDHAPKLLRALLAAEVRRLAETALREEEQARKASGRESMLKQAAQKVFNKLESDVILRWASRQAGLVIAEEARRRVIQEWTFALWARRLKQVRELRRQRERLDYVRCRLAEKNLLVGSKVLHTARDRFKSMCSASAAPVSATQSQVTLSHPNDDGDDNLRASFAAFQAERTSLWAEGTFLVSVARRVSELASCWRPVDMTTYTVILCLFADESTEAAPAEVWLRRKFGLTNASERLISVTDETTVRSELVVGCDVDSEKKDIGLVIFALSSQLANKSLSESQHRKIWKQETERLRQISCRNGFCNNCFRPLLLVVDWRSPGSMYSTLNALEIESTAPKIWAEVEVVSLGEAAEPDTTFETAVRALVRAFYPATRPRAVSLAQVIETFREPWTEATVLTHSLLGPLLDTTAPKDEDKTTICIEAFVTMIVLANHALSCILRHSETLIENADDVLLPRFTVNSLLVSFQDCSPSAALYGAGRELIETTTASPLTQTILWQAARNTVPFPFTSFLESLFQSCLSLLEENWLGLYEDADLRDEEGALVRGARQLENWASDSLTLLTGRIRAVLDRASANVSQSPVTRPRRRKRETLAGDAISKPAVKRMRDDGRVSEGSADFAPSPHVDRLRRLIASANLLLSTQASATAS